MNNWIETFLIASRDAAVLSIIVGLLILMVGRFIPAGWRHALWLLIAIRLLIPVLPTSPLSWQRVMESRKVYISQVQPEIVSDPSLVASPVLVNLDHSTAVDSETNELEMTAVSASNVGGENIVTPPEEEFISWTRILLTVWISGVTFFLCIGVLLTWRFHRKLSSSSPLNSKQAELEALLEGIAEEGGWKKLPQIQVTEAVDVPAIFGLFRPIILIPPTTFENLSDMELRLVIMHELGHWRRRDLWVNLVLAFLQAIHWFNPFVWWAFHRARVESERATDTWVLRRAGAREALNYGRMLLQLLDQSSQPQTVYSGVISVVESPKDLERRMKGIVKFTGKHNRIALLGSLAALLAVATVGLTQPSASDHGVENETGVTEKKLKIDARVFTCRVLSAEGIAVPNAKVYYQAYSVLQKKSDASTLAGITDQYGECNIRLDLKFMEAKGSKLELFVNHSVDGYGARRVHFPITDPIAEVALSKGEALSFHVTDENGEPIPKLRLRVREAKFPAYPENYRNAITSGTFWGEIPKLSDDFWNAVTNEQGNCSILGLRPGRYYVDHDNLNYAQPPGRRDFKFQYNTEEQQGVVELQLLKAVAVSGKVRLPDGTPVVGAFVKTLENRPYKHGGCSAQTITDSEGRFRLDRLLPSIYSIRVIASEDMQEEWAMTLQSYEIKQGENLENLEVQMERGGLVKGRVTLSDTGEPVPNYFVGATSQSPGISLDDSVTLTDENGYYRIRLPAGEIKIYSEETAYKGYTTRVFGERQVAQSLEIVNGGTYESNLEFQPRARVSGIVVDSIGNPVIGANISCLSPLDRMSHVIKTVSDQKGRFFINLPARTEEAHLVAEHKGEISLFDKKYTTSEDATLILTSGQFAKATGRVVDTEGNPIEGAKVTWGYEKITGVTNQTTSNVDGYFEALDVLPGKQVIFYGSKDGFIKGSSSSDFKSAESKKLKAIVLPRGDASVSGKLVDELGNPVQDAVVSENNSGAETSTNAEGKFTLQGLEKGWLFLQASKNRVGGPAIAKLRVNTEDPNIVIKLSDDAWDFKIKKPVDFLNKGAPLLAVETWLNSEPLPQQNLGKVRLVQFVGMDRPLIYFSNVLPALERLRKEIPDENLEIILVHGRWPKKEVLEILASHYPDFKLPIAIESKKGAMSEVLGVQSWQTIVIDQKGKIVFQDMHKWNKIKQKVRQLLKNDK